MTQFSSAQQPHPQCDKTIQFQSFPSTNPFCPFPLHRQIKPSLLFSLPSLALCWTFSLSVSLCNCNSNSNMFQPLLWGHQYHPSSYSYSWISLSPSPTPTHNNNNKNNNSSNCSLFLSSSTSPSSPISTSFHGPISSLNALHQQHGSSQQGLVDSSVSVDLIPIYSDSQFHQLIALTRHTQHPLITVWMANWCRNCIYLKPKLEKLAAEYYPRLQFYSVDVNTVSHKLVARAGVTKMPTIQLWKDGKKQAEVIGGRKAHWIIGDVQEMIENECTM